MIHRLSSFTFLKKTKKELRRHSVSEPPKAASPIERMLKALFSPPRSLSASNKSAEAILISLSGSPYVTFRGTIKPQRRDSDSDSALWQPESPSRPSWRDEAYWLDQLDGWEQSRYHTTREILPDHEWPRRAEELYHSLVDECFKVFERSADAKAWLIDALPMMLWCIEAPTAGDFFEARESNAPMVPFIAREVPESYDRLIRHLDNSDHKAGEPLPDGYRKFLLPDESTYLRLAAYCRRIKRSHEAQCYFLHKESERRV